MRVSGIGITMKGVAVGFVLSALLSMQPAPAQAAGKVLSSVGPVYPIAEQDLVQMIKERLAKVDWQKLYREAGSELKTWHPPVPDLPPAARDRVFSVVPTQKLPFDIKDQFGNVLYPSGMEINPLDYVTATKLYVIVDASRKEQLDWLAKTEYKDNVKVTILVSGGDRERVAHRFHQEVFWLTEDLEERLKVEATPTVVRQVGNKLELSEFYVPAGRGR